jgi:hypothetical protein
MNGMLLSEVIQKTVSAVVENQVGGKAISWTEIVGAIGGAVGAVTGIIAIILAAKAWATARTQLRQQIYHDLMSEYRTPVMYEALNAIGACKADNMWGAVDKYQKRIAAEQGQIQGLREEQTNTYSFRRQVFHYYHQIALTASEEDRSFKQDIVPKAIIPIEIWYENKNRHVGEIDFEVKSPHLRSLQKMYDDAPD